MALFECKKKTTTIGNVYAEVGDVSLSSSVTTKVTLGWQPDEVWVYTTNQPFNSNTVPTTASINLTTLNDNNKVCYLAGAPGYPPSFAKYTLPNTTGNYINSIDSDGFTIGTSTRPYARYIAYKFKD